MRKFSKAILLQNGGMGDFLMAIFLAERLKEYGVTEDIRIVMHKGSAWLKGCIGEYPYLSLTEASLRRPATLQKLLALFGRNNLVIVPPTIGRFPLKTKFLAWALSKPGGTLVGFKDTGPTWMYTQALPYDTAKCFDESMDDVVRALGGNVARAVPRLSIRPAPHALEAYGLANERYVLIHPRGAAKRRQLDEGEAEELITAVLATHPNRRVLLAGAEHERAAIEQMAHSASDPSRVTVAIGAKPDELAALIKGAELYVGMDTGPTHLACFLGARALVIAKNATANWLPYYNKNATVIYRFKEEEEARTDEAYMWAHQAGRLRPFKDIPMSDVNAVLTKMLVAG